MPQPFFPSCWEGGPRCQTTSSRNAGRTPGSEGPSEQATPDKLTYFLTACLNCICEGSTKGCRGSDLLGVRRGGILGGDLERLCAQEVEVLVAAGLRLRLRAPLAVRGRQ